LSKANKNVIKTEEKIADGIKDLEKNKAKHQKNVEKGKVAPVDEIKALKDFKKQEEKIAKLKENLEKAKRELSKLK